MMQMICDDLKLNVNGVVAEWERLAREQPWYTLPTEHRIDSVPEVVLGLVDASLCNPTDGQAHQQHIRSAADHGHHRRNQGISEQLLFTEYHLLRQAIWYYLVRRFGHTDAVIEAIMRIDTAITVATNASLWGYHRDEIEALGKWQEGMDRLVRASPLLQVDRRE
jgi:hypothetical protein